MLESTKKNRAEFNRRWRLLRVNLNDPEGVAQIVHESDGLIVVDDSPEGVTLSPASEIIGATGHRPVTKSDPELEWLDLFRAGLVRRKSGVCPKP